MLESIAVSNRDFVSALREYLFDEGLSMSGFCEKAGLPESTLYKIMSDPEKDFRVSTLRQILRAVRESESPTVQGTVVGIITARSVLSQIE
ncbi:MAG: helix-turn-helix domain-containing protein, partial [Thermoplasmatota archaeon]